MRSDYDGQLWQRVEESGRNLVVVNDWLCDDRTDEGYQDGLGCTLEPIYRIERCTCLAAGASWQLADYTHAQHCARYVEATA